VGNQHQAPVALSPEEKTRCPLYRRAAGPRSPSVWTRKISPHLKLDPRTVQSVVGLNRSIIYVSTTFILTNNDWTTCFDCYSVILRSFSMAVNYRELCAHWDPKCVYIKTWAIHMHRGLYKPVVSRCTDRLLKWKPYTYSWRKSWSPI